MMAPALPDIGTKYGVTVSTYCFSVHHELIASNYFARHYEPHYSRYDTLYFSHLIRIWTTASGPFIRNVWPHMGRS